MQEEGARVFGMDQRKYIQRLLFIELFLREAAYAAMIPAALTIMRKYGHGATMSGLIIGANKASGYIGLALQMYTTHLSPKVIIIMNPFFRFIGSALFAMVLYASDQGVEGNWIVWMLFVARFIEGAGGGFSNPAMRTVFYATCTSKEELDKVFVNRTLLLNLGLGLGPMMAAGGHWCAQLLFPTHALTGIPLISMFSTGCFLVVFTLTFPSELPPEKEFGGGGGEGGKSGSPLANYNLKVVVLACCVCCFLRQFMTAGIESGSAYILEEDVGWDLNSVGIAVSCVFLFCVPINAIYTTVGFSERCSLTLIKNSGWIVVLICLCMNPAVLAPFRALLPAASEKTLLAWQVAITSGAAYPVLYLSGGLLDGLIQKIVKENKEGNFGIKTVSTILVALMMASRSIGPPVSRWALEIAGTAFYSYVMAAFSLVMWITFVIFASPAATVRQDHNDGLGADEYTGSSESEEESDSFMSSRQ